MTDAQRKTLIRQRGAVKAKLTSFSNHLTNIQKKPNIEDLDIFQIQERIAKADLIFSEFNTMQNDLETLASDNEIENEYLERSTFLDAFYSVIALAKKIVADYEHKQRDGSIQGGQSNIELNNVKLPTIDLPKFDGSFDLWLEFRDIFESLIHVNSTINKMQKYHYLRASLRGSATQVIKSIEFSASNYDIAWETLCERYNNTRLLVHNHTKALFCIEPIKKESSSKIRNLVDTISKHLRSLTQLKQPTEKWDTLIIYLATTKLDNVSSREWEQYVTGKDVPSLNDLKAFLKGRADLLETLEAKNEVKVNATSNSTKYSFRKDQVTKGFHTANLKCAFCKKEHTIYNCEDFGNLTANEKIDFVRKSKLCTNCLKGGHFEKHCRFGPCRKCQRRHNSLLHVDTTQEPSASTSTTSSSNSNESNKVSSFSSKAKVDEVLLGTAIIQIYDKFQKLHTVRALLDCGSQSSFITADLIDLLKLDKSKINITVECLMNMQSQSQYRCDIQIQSPVNGFKSNLSCIILPKITSGLPSLRLNPNFLEIPNNIKLADPDFYKPGNIDILIGADLFWKLICVGQIDLGRDKPVLQKTRFGWIVSGPVKGTQSKKVKCNLSKNYDIQNELSKFWEIEECPTTRALSSEERACEQHFIENTIRDAAGRFIVSLPLKTSPSCLGYSKEQATNRFMALERKLQKNEYFKEQYIHFMSEYETLDHMSEIKDSDSAVDVYFMPHHGVLKSDSITTKLRVVFDASASTTTGVSLNNIQMVGPIIQDDLLSIILRFRKHVYVVSADIAKMYRQVLVKPEHRALQRISWRASPSDNLKTYNLNTVTYGQASASFLSIRCLFELANQCESVSPDIAQIIKHDFYVDDLLTGANSIEEASYICKNVSKVLKQGCFELRKWFSNEPTILEDIGQSELSYNILNFGVDQNAKTLGLIWNCNLDKLMFKIDTTEELKNITKRSILSHISQIFDPLGLLSPCTIIAKLMIQKLWLERVTWDESLPAHIHSAWIAFKRELPYLNTLEIPRLVLCEEPVNIELHGFCDSSEVAYGGSIFLRSVDEVGKVSVHLLCAKSKVAPIKSLTLPRLELCGALVLSKLAYKVLKSINFNYSRCIFWTDSTIVLGWIKTSPHLLKTFISNRVSEIQNLTSCYEWRHVPTKCNPADLLSRGVYPSQMQNLTLWWRGPDWLSQNCSEWPNLICSNDDLPELREPIRVSLLVQNHKDVLVERYSDLSKLKRVVAFILRFKNNCKTNILERQSGPLKQSEIVHAFHILIKMSQIESFPYEYNSLIQGKIISHKELVTDLTAEAFILALRRFVSRRGKPAIIYSDNGTNFVRANKELQILGEYLISNKDHLVESFSREGLEWYFIPPGSPHFGGLWEAGIKSTKHHLKRVMGNASLTFEELNTLLVQVEAILNSRPLFPISSDPNDLYSLTPAHFLVGKTLTSVPDPELRQISENRLSRYQKIQQLQQHFWNRWSKEYVAELQQRHRWKTNPNQLKEGSLVIIKEDNLPPLQWRMGRVMQLHPGSDGINRVASIKTSNGIVQRTFPKICPLPIEQ